MESRCAQQGRPARSLWRRARAIFLSGLVLYVPNAPRPFSGRTRGVAGRKLAYVDISVEDALARIVSTGSVIPDALRAARLTEKAPRVSPVGGH